MKSRLKKENKDNRIKEDDEFYEKQSEKKYRSLKKIKRDKPPHKKWND